MRIIYSALLICLVFSVSSYGQDEGSITRKERIAKSSNIFIGGGLSVPLTGDIGDYNLGFNVEGGFLKRLNRVLSIGPSISYISFKYDPDETRSSDPKSEDLYKGNTANFGGDINGWHERYDEFGLPPNQQWDFGYLLSLQGGNISLLSLAVNLKLNLVPVRDDRLISVYLLAKPFVTSAKRSAVSGTGNRYVYEAYEQDEILYYNEQDDFWYPDGQVDQWDQVGYPSLKSESVISGGIFVGGGVEFRPGKALSFFLQPQVGYTFPISFVSTKAYGHSINDYLNDDFPIVKKGFASLNIQLGVSYNF